MKRTTTNKSTQRKKPTLEWVGYLQETDSFHLQVFKIFSDAGFNVEKLEVNRDLSMATFSVKQHPYLKNDHEGCLAITRLLRAGGVKVKSGDVAFWLDKISIGGFIPPQNK